VRRGCVRLVESGGECLGECDMEDSIRPRPVFESVTPKIHHI